MARIIHVVSPEEARRGSLVDGIVGFEVAKAIGELSEDQALRPVLELSDGSLRLETAEEFEARRERGELMHPFESWKPSEESQLDHMLWRRCGRRWADGLDAWNKLTGYDDDETSFIRMVRGYDDTILGVLGHVINLESYE